MMEMQTTEHEALTNDLNTFDYCCDVRDHLTGAMIFQQFECVVTVDEIDTSGDDVRITVSIAGTGGMGTMAKAIYAYVCNQAESDDSLIERVMERNGIYTTARPGSDDAIEWKRD